MKNFINISSNLLLKFLEEPWALSFFPSSYFWNRKEISWCKTHELYSSFFSEIGEDHILNLYIHIPFCSRICSYCNCFKNLLWDSHQVSQYIECIQEEAQEIFQANKRKKIRVRSIFIWWWTPNILSLHHFEKIFYMISEYFDTSYMTDFLIDGHPNYYTREKIQLFSSHWVTRVTLALQTLDNGVLEENNRDIYDIEHVEKILQELKKYNIASNIDLLIWLSGQSFSSVRHDIERVRELDVSHVSLHYFMPSNNIAYTIPDNYHRLVTQVKEYIKKNPLPEVSPNIQESDYASKESSIIWIGAHAVTHLFWKIVYKNHTVSEYMSSISLWNFSWYKWKKLTKRDEMTKHIYLNILQWVSIESFFQIFWENIFYQFPQEFRFLREKKVVYIRDNIIFSCMNDRETLIYCNIFYLQYMKWSISWDKKKLSLFFDSHGNMIDK